MGAIPKQYQLFVLDRDSSDNDKGPNALSKVSFGDP